MKLGRWSRTTRCEALRRGERSGSDLRPALSARVRSAGNRDYGGGAVLPAGCAWPERPRQEVLRTDRPSAINRQAAGRRVFGELAGEEMAAIDEGLAVFLGLGDCLKPARQVQ